MRTAVVIPNWNGEKVLPHCLTALRTQTTPPNQIILVDNHSTDQSVLAAMDCCPGIQVVALERNFGFGYAANRGIEASDADLVLLLNNDTRAQPGWIAALLDYFCGNPQAQFCACKMLNYFDPSIIDGAGDCLTRSGIPYKIGSSQRDSAAYSTLRKVFGASGGGAAFRREFFEKVGMFDERFFMYLEDVDLSLRAQLLGIECHYVPDAVIHHMEAQSDPDRKGQGANPQTPSRVYWIARNRILLLAKNYPSGLLFRYSLLILGAFGKSFLFHLLKTGLVGPYLMGLRQGLRDTTLVLQDRRTIQASMLISTRELRRLLKQC
jgi:GT2 family glycosyltransferase